MAFTHDITEDENNNIGETIHGRDVVLCVALHHRIQPDNNVRDRP